MEIVVSEDINASTPFISLSVDKILFLEYENRKKMTVVHTLTNQYYIPGALSYWCNGLQNSGFGFEMLDRNNAVQMSKIKYFDSRSNIAFFEEQRTKSSKFCTVSFTNIKRVVESLRRNISDVTAT